MGPVSQGMYQAATLGLIQAMDILGLSTEASQLEASLGPYWEVSEAERRAAKEKHDTFELVNAAASRLGRARAAPMVGRLSFLAGRYSLTGTAPNLNTASMKGRANIPNGAGTVSFGSEALPLDAPVPTWLEDAGKLMGGQGLDSGGLLSSVRNVMVLRSEGRYRSYIG